MQQVIELRAIRARLKVDMPDWSEEMIDQAIDQYIKFLKLSKRYPDITIVPTRLADEVWHRHILFTKKYADDCNHIFGYFLHHEPFREHTSEASINQMVNQTKELYEKHFGPWPSDPTERAACPGGNCSSGSNEPKCDRPTCANVRG